MIVLSYNIRGGGSRAKRKRVGLLIQKEDADVCFIQETKLSGINLCYVKEMWGSGEVEWSHSDASGASDGILIMWKKDFFSLLFSFRGEGFLGLCVELHKKKIYLINIYASCDTSVRRRTWQKILDFKNSNLPGSWCLGGDFNSISHLEERIGVANRSYRNEINYFKGFIDDMDLVDVPTIGGKFTWFNSNGKAMSRIDRFLLSPCFIDDWNVEGQIIGSRDLSDHAPIWIKDNRKNWGPKSFKFNKLWLKHSDFTAFVEDEWNLL
ncbi:uncharacterized protein LOC131597788 [Vicia villosa]|uniref:uncharacterized protein LOC131597788 n=1 Tax=Vicia villosa TaxID=3911 RepID=UPI00273C7534|nr:uncharacterized protein LOC131597788 [Vicia villosa]